MRICLDLPHVFFPGSDSEDNAYVLKALLDCLITSNRVFLRSHPGTVPLYRSGVVYGRTEVWDSIPALYKRRSGDCKSLTAALVAEYLEQGIKCNPVFRWKPRANGVKDFHILVQIGNVFEDPSKRLGMGQDENRYFGSRRGG